MSEKSELPKIDDPLKADVQEALLAAFGDEAANWLNEAEALDMNIQDAATGGEQADSGLGDLLGKLSSAIEDSSVEASVTGIIEETDDDDEAIVDLGPRYVVFEIGDQQYGVPLDGVLEIDHCGKVTALPRTPNWLRGVTNLRGQILSVTDFRDLLGLNDQRRTVGEKIIVVQSEAHDSQTALVVDRVLGIRNLRGGEGSLDGLSDRLAAFTDSLAVKDQATTVLIDPDRLLGSNELSAYSTK